MLMSGNSRGATMLRLFYNSYLELHVASHRPMQSYIQGDLVRGCLALGTRIGG